MRKSLLLRSLVVLAVSAVASIASAQIQGAIYDTDITGTNVNQNWYDHCYDAYLNGGPQNENAQGLTPGDYYFQVTSPDGQTLLSADPVRNRRVVVGLDNNGDGRILGPKADPAEPGVYPGHFESAGQQYPGWVPDQNFDATPNGANGSQGVHLWPFDETPNNGGVYKIWLIPVEEYDATAADDPTKNFGFKNGQTKTDTFKCVHDNGDDIPPLAILSGSKFYDLDADHFWDDEEPPIAGWQIRVRGILGGELVDETILTDDQGNWDYELDAGTDFIICEIIPEASPAWTQTYPEVGDTEGPAEADADRCWVGTIPDLEDPEGNDIPGLDFGNHRNVSFSGLKFYDANANGVNDDGQVVAGVRINVFMIDSEGNETLYDPADPDQGFTTVTGADGTWSVTINLSDNEDYTFRIEEVLPGTTGDESDCYWLQTAPASGFYEVTGSAENLNFGNVCICPSTGGRTLGFWSNKNGQNILKNNDPAWRNLLNAVHLRKANGTEYDVPGNGFSTAYSNFRTWLLNATAVNMAYMLSAQLAANMLNTESYAFGMSRGDVVLLTPELAECWEEVTGSYTNTVTIGEVQDRAIAQLAANGYTPDGHPDRAKQECIKNILDALNNNLLPVVHGTPCFPYYP